MLLGAALGRAVGLPPDVVLASLPKCTTTGLAVHMAAALGGNPSLAAAVIALLAEKNAAVEQHNAAVRGDAARAAAEEKEFMLAVNAMY